MKNNLFRFWVSVVLILTGCTAACAKDLKIVFPQFTPPYVFENGSGIAVDLLKEALEPAGYKIIPVILPLARGMDLFANKRVDGTSLMREDSLIETNYSDEFIRYPNKAIALQSRQFDFYSTASLREKNIIAFQNAHKYLGPEYAQVVANNRRYQEIGNQEKQVLTLLSGTVDFVIMDENIFRFYREKLISEGKVQRSIEPEFFSIVPPTLFKAAFVDSTVRDDFNRGLAALRKSGRYQKIYSKYVDDYFPAKKR